MKFKYFDNTVRLVWNSIWWFSCSALISQLVTAWERCLVLLSVYQVEDSIGHVMVGEREFIISPNYAAMVMSALGIAQSPDSKIAMAKKPFDWMTDDQFHNLQILASHFEWFQDMFDRMPKDGREMQWRNLCENDSPEKQPLPDKMDEQYHPLQRMCVLRAVRSDRLMHATSLFINSVLGKK